jgi:membrane protein DedA with SNARE-associated domain
MDPSTVIQSWSYLGIIVFLVLTGCGLPIPEEVPILAAGVMSRGTLNPWMALISCLVGAVIGDIVMYGLGRKFGRSLLQRQGYLHSLLSAEREQQIEEQFRLHGLKVLFAARFLVGIRTPIYITAGILKVPFRRFVVADMLCASIVIPLFFGVAYLFSDQVNRLWQLLRQAEIAVSVTVVVSAIAAVSILRYVRKRRAAEHAAADSRRSDLPVAKGREKSVA